MKKFLPFIICFALLLSISFSGTVFAAVNETEPNNTMTTASPLRPGDTVNGKISTSSDLDYYMMQLTASGNINISLGTIPSGCDYDLYLYDNRGSLIRSSTAGSNTDENISNTLNAGTYYVCVKSYSGYSASSNYTLSVKSSGSTNPPTTPPVHGGDAYEFNDTLELASDFYGSLEANIHPLGDVDWYRFSVTQTSAKHIRLYNPSADLTYHFSIYNANGGYVCSDGGIGDYTVTLSPGTYYVKVFSYNSESVLNYRLQMTTV